MLFLELNISWFINYQAKYT